MMFAYAVALLPVRIAQKVRVCLRSGCWVWEGARNGEGLRAGWDGGYGYVWHTGSSRRAHRVVWEILVGPIPDGAVLDHGCSRRDCVNPMHLEPVTHGENTRRGYERKAA